MTLAEKIIKLRKENGWSQEELADRLDITRQSVSKWESATSVPELNKIILLADIFNVTVDSLVKEDAEEYEKIDLVKKHEFRKISIDEAKDFEQFNIRKTQIIAQNVMLCIYAFIPLFLLLALRQGDIFKLSSEVSVGIGLASSFIIVSIAIRGFITAGINSTDYRFMEKQEFTLEYGIKEIYHEKLRSYRLTYSRKLSFSIILLLISVLPLILSGVFHFSSMIALFMLTLMLLLIGGSVSQIIRTVSKYKTYQCILQEGDYSAKVRLEMMRYQKYAFIYWPIVLAIYLLWSFWTMSWGVTWLVWPVASVLFVALLGIVNLFTKNATEK